ncbi:MAG: Ig-like domain-containing protein [Thermoplasmatota archaeon]
MKNIIVLVILSCFILNFLVIFAPYNSAQKIIKVGPTGPPDYDFDSINDAIKYANESDIIYVYSGTYNENIVIDKAVTIKGENSETTIIISSSADNDTVKITANYVNVSGLTIRNLGGSYSCIRLLYYVTCCVISNCNIKNAGNGIYLIFSNNNTIKDNNIEKNNIGIYLQNSNNNIIMGNKIKNNYANGVFISSVSSNNIIYLNDFSGNPDSNAKDYGNNNWDHNAQGNYWDDYNDYDSDKDGIGDNPYIIIGNGNNRDNFPLGYFLTQNYKLVISIDFLGSKPAIDGQTISGNIVISGTTSDFNGYVTLVEIKIDNGNWQSATGTSTWSKSFDTNTVTNGQHTIYARCKDNNGDYSNIKSVTVNVQNEPDNQPPTVEITIPNNQQTLSGIVTLAGTAYDLDGEVILVEVKIDNGNWQAATGTTSWNFIWNTTNLTNGQHTVYARSKDNKGQWSAQVSKNFIINQNTSTQNQPPVANAKGPYAGFVNQSIIFRGSSSYDPNPDDTIYYYWDFGDGTTGEGVIAEHVYITPGNYTIQLTVTDNYGLWSKDSTYIIINSQTDDEKNNNKNKVVPGFEIVILVFAILFILIRNKKIS